MTTRRAGAVIIAVMFAGCYAQQPLPREPTHTPASWEPIMRLRTRTGEQIMFDEPGKIESGRGRLLDRRPSGSSRSMGYAGLRARSM